MTINNHERRPRDSGHQSFKRQMSGSMGLELWLHGRAIFNDLQRLNQIGSVATDVNV